MSSTVVGDPLASVSIMTSTTTASPVTATIVTETNNETVIDCGTFDFEEVAPYRFWCDGVLVSSVGIVGLVGNVLAMLVLSRPRMRDAFHQVNLFLKHCSWKG